MGLTVAGATALSAGIGAISKLFGNSQTAAYNAAEAQKDRDFQERMYNQQVKDNLAFWQKQVDYANPSAELARLREAGLNPMLYYGQGGSSANVSAPQPASAPSGSKASAHFDQSVDLANLALLQAQKENLEADSMKKINEGLKASADTVKSHTESDWLRDTWEIRKEEIRADYDLKRAYEQTEVSKRNEIQVNIERSQKEMQLIDAEISNKNRLTDQEIKESNQRIENSVKECAAACAKMDAETRKAEADAFYARAMGAIVNSPEYRKSAIKLKAEELRKAISEGDIAAIEAGMNAWIYQMRPKEGSSAYEYRMWIDNWVTPVTESLGRLLGGSATYTVSSKKK